ncbi:MAG: DUF445 family protein [Paludibacteraceae bacterium]|nr:DUF445 family protein [Paludibacteraceae bacterium]
MWYNYLIPPVVGAIIGYFTNELAIKMLFRPKTPKYIFGMRVPFTPGIIPKEKSRIATAIGETISKNLMDKDTMTKSLLSEEMILKLSNAIDTFVNTQKENSEDVRTFLSHYINLEDMDKMVTEASDKFSQNISTKIANSNLGEEISTKVVEYAMEQSKNSLLGLFGTDKIIQLLSKPTERILSKHIGNILSNNAKEIISPMVDGQVNSFLETPVCDFIQGREERIEKIKTMILDAYKNIISNQLPRILESIDIKKIVEDRINEMKIEETEQLTYGVVSNELRAIVLLGALLGGIIGLANLAFI